MITIIAITLVLAISLIAALVSKFTLITKLKNKVDDLETKFKASYQSYDEFQKIYAKLADSYESGYKLHSQGYKDIRETYTRLMDLLQEYTSCLPENIRAELKKIEDKEKYFDDDEMWNQAEAKLREVLNELGVEYFEAVGEAAFYGPKLDVEVKPAVGPEITLSTCQLDFLLPRKFELSYVDSDGSKKVPVVLHRAIFGTFDRFTAFILEETKGILPLWLSPTQINVIPVNDEYCVVLSFVNQDELSILIFENNNFENNGTRRISSHYVYNYQSNKVDT